MPKLSIITICYNEPNLEKTCESIVNQTFQDFEWIVVDGGSNEETQKIWDKYKYRINTFISEPDTGRYNAMNKGIRLATGEYLNFMNAGDSFSANVSLEKIFKHNYTEDVLYADLVAIKETPIEIVRFPDKLDKAFFIKYSLGHQSSFIKKELFDKYGNYSEEYKIVSDWEKWIVFLVINKCSYRHIDVVCSIFNLNGISWTNDILSKQEQNIVLSQYFSKKDIKKYSLDQLHYSFWEQIFSVKNDYSNKKRYKVIKIFGFTIKIRRKNIKNQLLKDAETIKKIDNLFIPPWGIGDGIMFSVVAKKLFETTGKKVWVSHKNNELFKHNPYIETVDDFYDTQIDAKIKNQFLQNGTTLIYDTYWKFKKNFFGKYTFVFPDCHAIAQMAKNAGIKGEIELKPEIYLTDEEKKFGRFVARDKKQIVIMSTAVNKNKQWDKWQELVDALKDKYKFVQLGASNDIALNDVIDKRGKLTIRESACVLYNSDLFVGQIGGLMHLARAVDCPSVIVYSSAEPEYFAKYICNYNIMPQMPCLKCATNQHNSFLNRCPKNYECVKNIQLEDVIQAVDRAIANHKQELEIEKYVIEECNNPSFEDYYKREKCG